VHDDATRRDIVDTALEQGRRLTDGGTTPPLLDESWIAGGGQRAFAEVRTHPQRVLILPAQVRLRLFEAEAALDEALGDRVELPILRRVGTTPGQADHAALVLGRQALCPFPDPVLGFCLGQRIEVDHRLPGRLVLDELIQRGAAPDAANVLGIAPEVVDLLAADGGRRDTVARVVDLEHLLVDLLVLRNRLEHRGVGGAALAGPLESLGVLDLLQPEMWILLLRDSGDRE
jgi:hypothetical protein